MADAGKARIADIADALSAHGLLLRGGFHPEAEEEEFVGFGTVLLVGNAGPAMWEVFSPHNDGAPHPLDRWTRGVVDPIAREFGARAVYPFGPAAPSFQRWALRAETLYRSPIGILIHPEYGLWHAFRGALLFAERLALPPRAVAPNPCESCAEKPCLQACPVGAFTTAGYDVSACAGYLAGGAVMRRGPDCRAGCQARNACPVAKDRRYPESQIRFHMAAFAASVMPTS